MDMEVEDEIFIEDDLEILEIMDFGFPSRLYETKEYFDSMDNLTFFKRFRLTKGTALSVLDGIEVQLEFDNDLNNSVSPINQLLASLRFYACGTHQDAVGDFMGIHQTTASRIIKKVSNLIALLRPIHIKMPQGNEIIKVQSDFYEIGRFPGAVGCIDGTHIRMKSPGGPDAEIFRNRKGYFSLNTQLVCDAKLKIRDIVVRWPGSAHDMTIFNHSNLRTRMELREFGNSVLLVAAAVLHNIARDMNEEMPPLPENLNGQQLNYLINLGDIPQVPNNEPNINLNNHRENLVNNYFANL